MLWISMGIVVGVLVLLLLDGVGIYNRLVTLKNRFKNAFSQIECS